MTVRILGGKRPPDTETQKPEELKSPRDIAKSAAQLSAAISAEVKRGELRRFYVKQIESARVEEFSKMYDEEGRFIRGSDALLRSMEPGVPPQQSRTIQTGVPNAS